METAEDLERKKKSKEDEIGRQTNLIYTFGGKGIIVAGTLIGGSSLATNSSVQVS